jgi:hypothetical protein
MILTVLRTPKDADKGENVVLLRRGRLYLADLAGSERINKSGKVAVHRLKLMQVHSWTQERVSRNFGPSGQT